MHTRHKKRHSELHRKQREPEPPRQRPRTEERLPEAPPEAPPEALPEAPPQAPLQAPPQAPPEAPPPPEQQQTPTFDEVCKEKMEKLLEKEYQQWQYLFASQTNKMEIVVVLAKMLSMVFTTSDENFSKEKMAKVRQGTTLSESTCKKLFRSMVTVLKKVEQGSTVAELQKSFDQDRAAKKAVTEEKKKKEEQEAVEWVDKKCKAHGGAITLRGLSELAKIEKRKHTSMSYFHRIMVTYFRPCKLCIKPCLSTRHVTARLEFVQRILYELETTNPALLYDWDDDTLMIHVDEKWFASFSPNLTVYVRKGEAAPYVSVYHKNHIPKIMFFAAIGRPVFNSDGTVRFDGRVLFSVVHDFEYAPRAMLWNLKRRTMNAERFVEYMKWTTIEAVQNKKQHGFKRVVIQTDNAGGHGGGRGNMNETVLKELNEWAQHTFPGEPIHYMCQPSQSPDLNALDLGAWNSLKSVVQFFMTQTNKPQEESGRTRSSSIAWLPGKHGNRRKNSKASSRH